MEKEEVIVRPSKNRELTELALLNAVNTLIEDRGFENLGVNAVAAKAGVSKMLIYRYFDSLDGLIAAYIQKYDYWINLEPELPGTEHLGDFIKELFRNQIRMLHNDYTPVDKQAGVGNLDHGDYPFCFYQLPGIIGRNLSDI